MVRSPSGRHRQECARNYPQIEYAHENKQNINKFVTHRKYTCLLYYLTNERQIIAILSIESTKQSAERTEMQRKQINFFFISDRTQLASFERPTMTRPVSGARQITGNQQRHNKQEPKHRHAQNEYINKLAIYVRFFALQKPERPKRSKTKKTTDAHTHAFTHIHTLKNTKGEEKKCEKHPKRSLIFGFVAMAIKMCSSRR